jgi:hypothetical protein
MRTPCMVIVENAKLVGRVQICVYFPRGQFHQHFTRKSYSKSVGEIDTRITIELTNDTSQGREQRNCKH